MKYLVILFIIIWLIDTIFDVSGTQKRLAQYFEQKRIDRLTEIERLTEENNRRCEEEYYKNRRWR